MFAKERQDDIVNQVNLSGHVKVKELSLKYQVTEDCIRKDLSLLEKKELLKKTYGGAMSLRKNPHLYSSIQRKDMNDKQRQEIAKKVISLLENQDTIYLDISRTNVEVAHLLNVSSLSLIVITNMIEILDVLKDNQNISVVFIGGELNKERDGFWGGLSLQMIQQFKIDKAFLGVVGVQFNNGDVSTYYIEDGLMKQRVMKQSQRNYLLCETRKLSEDGQFIYGNLKDVDGLILSDVLNQDYQEYMKIYDIEML